MFDYLNFQSSIHTGGERDRDVCTGDGGAPIVCEIPGYPNSFYQAGIVVGGIDCNAENVPGLYADVSKYRKWIDEKLLGESGINSSSYTFLL